MARLHLLRSNFYLGDFNLVIPENNLQFMCRFGNISGILKFHFANELIFEIVDSAIEQLKPITTLLLCNASNIRMEPGNIVNGKRPNAGQWVHNWCNASTHHLVHAVLNSPCVFVLLASDWSDSARLCRRPAAAAAAAR